MRGGVSISDIGGGGFGSGILVRAKKRRMLGWPFRTPRRRMPWATRGDASILPEGTAPDAMLAVLTKIPCAQHPYQLHPIPQIVNYLGIGVDVDVDGGVVGDVLGTIGVVAQGDAFVFFVGYGGKGERLS